MRANQPINFIQGLQLVFIGAKLFGATDWSWGSVLIPLWIELFFLVVASINDAVNNKD